MSTFLIGVLFGAIIGWLFCALLSMNSHDERGDDK